MKFQTSRMSETNKKRRTEITIETYSLTIIRTRGAKTDFIDCRICRAKVAGFPVGEAALIFRVEAGELKRLSRINLIHFADAEMLCGKSLAGFFKKEIRYVED